MLSRGVDKNAIYRVTEWEWLKLQIKLSTMDSKSETLSARYEFRDSKEPAMFNFRKASLPRKVDIVCMIFGAYTNELIRSGASKKEQLEYYPGWVRLEKQRMEKILNTLPILKKQLNLNTHAAFLIMHHYGMGSSRVCMFLGDEVTWFKKGRPD